jgi:hypothetical protein
MDHPCWRWSSCSCFPLSISALFPTGESLNLMNGNGRLFVNDNRSLHITYCKLPERLFGRKDLVDTEWGVNV